MEGKGDTKIVGGPEDTSKKRSATLKDTIRPPREEMLARARSMIPALRERAPAAETARCLADDTIRELHENDLWRIIQPARIGGGEYDYFLLPEIASELARGCGSTAWVFNNLAVHHWMLAMWPPQAQDIVWDRNPDTLIASSVIYPAGKAKVIDGGYMLTGRWPFCSGIIHSEWTMFGAMVSAAGSDGKPEPRMFLVPNENIEFLDTWDVMGLAATGSLDARCEALFVPDYMTVAANAVRGDITPGSVVNPAPVFRQSVAGLFPHLIASVIIGIAQGTWDLCVESMREKNARSSGRKISEMVPVQNKIAEAGSLIDAARALLKSNFEESRIYAETGELPPVDAKLRWRRDGALISKLASDAAHGLYRTAGASAVYNSSHLQRHIRDITVGMTHAHVSWEINGPAYGRVALGMETDNPLI